MDPSLDPSTALLGGFAKDPRMVLTTALWRGVPTLALAGSGRDDFLISSQMSPRPLNASELEAALDLPSRSNPAQMPKSCPDGAVARERSAHADRCARWTSLPRIPSSHRRFLLVAASQRLRPRPVPPVGRPGRRTIPLPRPAGEAGLDGFECVRGRQKPRALALPDHPRFCQPTQTPTGSVCVTRWAV